MEKGTAFQENKVEQYHLGCHAVTALTEMKMF
jgi:hypothetical protein